LGDITGGGIGRFSFTNIEADLAELRLFREEAQQLLGLSFAGQSAIELSIQRTRDELEDRILFAQRLVEATTGTAGF